MVMPLIVSYKQLLLVFFSQSIFMEITPDWAGSAKCLPKEPLELLMRDFSQARCYLRHPTNSVKALKETCNLQI